MHVDSPETSWVSNCEACLLLQLPACVCVAGLLTPGPLRGHFRDQPCSCSQTQPRDSWVNTEPCGSGSSRGQTPSSWKIGIRPSWYSGMIFWVLFLKVLMDIVSQNDHSKRPISQTAKAEKLLSPSQWKFCEKMPHSKKGSFAKSSNAQQSVICSLATHTFSWTGERAEGLFPLNKRKNTF